MDPHWGQVLDAATLDPISGSRKSPHHSGLAASLCHVTPAVRTLLASFPAIVSDGSGIPTPKHGVSHSIETTGRPVFAKARRLDPEKHRIAEAEFQILEKPVSYGGQKKLTVVISYLFLSRMAHGDHVEITAG